MLLVSALLMAVIFIAGTLPFFIGNVVTQAALFSVASAFLSVLIGLMVVNIFLNSGDRKRAAFPLLSLVQELVEQQHNELFIAKGRDTFGMEKFNNLLRIYADNNRNPEVFSPVDLDAIVDMIMSMKDQLLRNYIPLEASCRDIAYILGWTYDPKILTAILHSRSEILRFIKTSDLPQPLSMDAKRSLVEQYLDIDGAIGFWVSRLSQKLGRPLVKE